MIWCLPNDILVLGIFALVISCREVFLLSIVTLVEFGKNLSASNRKSNM